jgi:hypothetical protein
VLQRTILYVLADVRSLILIFPAFIILSVDHFVEGRPVLRQVLAFAEDPFAAREEDGEQEDEPVVP